MFNLGQFLLIPLTRSWLNISQCTCCQILIDIVLKKMYCFEISTDDKDMFMCTDQLKFKQSKPFLNKQYATNGVSPVQRVSIYLLNIS